MENDYFLILLQEIDGKSLMLLDLKLIMEYLNIQQAPALRLCHKIKEVKYAFYKKSFPKAIAS